MSGATLIAGVGNVFLGDDAFGCEVVRRVRASLTQLREDLELRDFGVGVRALGYALAERSARCRGDDTTVIVDAVATGAAPGTVQLFDLTATQLSASPLLAHHAHRLQDALETAVALGASLERTYLLGCEPASFEPAFGASAAAPSLLTLAVEAAARRCVDVLLRLIEQPDKDLVRACLALDP